MKYYIQRQLSEYGPYTLADIQRYVAQGSILLTDLTRSEGMTEWVPVSQVIGNIPAPMAAMPPVQPVGSAPVSSGGTVYGGTGTVYDATAPGYGMQPGFAPMSGPVPTDLHWALVLLITVFTCGLFGWAWLFVEAAYIKKIRPSSQGLLFSILGCASVFLGAIINGFLRVTTGLTNPANGLFTLVAIALVIVALFQMKSDLEDYYSTEEPIHLKLSGVVTFFFGIFYFQHHFSRIAQWKKTGVLQPQG
jgi:hypothetical protein